MRLARCGQRLFRRQRIRHVTVNGLSTNLFADPAHAVGVDVYHRYPGTSLDEIARRFRAQARCCAGNHCRACPQIHLMSPGSTGSSCQRQGALSAVVRLRANRRAGALGSQRTPRAFWWASVGFVQWPPADRFVSGTANRHQSVTNLSHPSQICHTMSRTFPLSRNGHRLRCADRRGHSAECRVNSPSVAEPRKLREALLYGSLSPPQEHHPPFHGDLYVSTIPSFQR